MINSKCYSNSINFYWIHDDRRKLFFLFMSKKRMSFVRLAKRLLQRRSQSKHETLMDFVNFLMCLYSQHFRLQGFKLHDSICAHVLIEIINNTGFCMKVLKTCFSWCRKIFSLLILLPSRWKISNPFRDFPFLTSNEMRISHINLISSLSLWGCSDNADWKFMQFHENFFPTSGEKLRQSRHKIAQLRRTQFTHLNAKPSSASLSIYLVVQP